MDLVDPSDPMRERGVDDHADGHHHPHRHGPAQHGNRTVYDVPRWLQAGASWSWRFLLVVGALGLIGWLLVRLRIVLVPVFIALVLAAAITPLVELFARVMPRLAAMWIAVLASVGAVVGLVAALWSPMADGISEIRANWSTALADIEDWLVDGPLGLDTDQVADLRRSAESAGERFVSGLAERPTEAVTLAAEILAGVVLTIVLTFFFAKDGSSMWRWFVDRVRLERRPAMRAAGESSITTLRGWLKATAITGVVDGLLIGIALIVLDVPAAIPLAAITFFAAFIPLVGATVAGALAAGIALAANGVGTAIAVAVVVFVVQQVEGDVVMPLIMQKHVSLHPAVVILALAIGSSIGGILGALLAVPLTAATVSAVSAFRATIPPEHGDQLVVAGSPPPSSG